MTKFLLIRHGLTNAVGKSLSGRMEGIPLNEEGHQQAQKLATRLKDVRINAIYSSPLERTIQTAAPVAEVKNLETIINNDLLEINYGDWTNRAFKELEDVPAFQRFNSFRSASRIPGGELMVEAQLRIVNALEKLRALHPDQTVAIFSHADLIKSAVTYYAGIHIDLFHRIEISPASVSIMEIFDDTVRILLVNDTGEINR